MDVTAAGAVDVSLRAIVGEKCAGGSAAPRIGGNRGHGAPSGKERRALHIDQSGAENGYSGIAHHLDNARGRRHTRGRRPEDECADSNDRDRAQALQKRRAKSDDETTPQGALIGEHIRGNHRLAVTGARSMENSIGKA